MSGAAGVHSAAISQAPVVKRRTAVTARGEPLVWLSAWGLAASLLMIAGLLLLILVNGTRTFWPRPIARITTTDGNAYLGEITRIERYRPGAERLAELPPVQADAIQAADGWAVRRLLRTGNFDLYGTDFRWIDDWTITKIDYPPQARIIERLEWGPFFGTFEEYRIDGTTVASGEKDTAAAFEQQLPAIRERRREMRRIEAVEISSVNRHLERLRLRLKALRLKEGAQAESVRTAERETAEEEAALHARYAALADRLAELRDEDQRYVLILGEAGGRRQEVAAGDVVRTYQANQLTWTSRLKIYFSRWFEFLTAEPREANMEGGVFPAIFGTVMMTILMSLVVAPLGVMAAIYLHEYASPGPLVSAVRISVGNLAGVPSIVYGIFGVGFFCYGVGGMIDQVFYPERLPSPTFGTTGILWSSLTLALLTLPVVIVASEEALSAVPRSMREGSYACGASKWQTIRRIVLPKALPGIMTGLILAMARGAGEVAPLMITGAVKLAPELPIDSQFPYFHLQRSFMHLGFHIYDLGFQSRNSEAAKPMVYTTTFLLLGIVVLLNFLAMTVRGRLQRRYRDTQI